MKLKRALTVSDILELKHEVYDFEGEWLDAFDRPEQCGTWFIWGESGNGKSSFSLQLAKYMTNFDKVIINALEEGTSLSIKNSFMRHGLDEVDGELYLVNETMEQLDKRLSRQRSPGVVLIDSIQYTGWTFKQYLDFKRKHNNKLMIIVSQAERGQPFGALAQRVMYDADLKILVEGHKAISKGRYIGETGEFTVWEKGAERYWGDV